MTLVAAWLRQNSNLRELVVASDSRLSGGESWDVCPKLVALPRPATVMAMSGDATEAYTFLLHAINTCALLEGTKSGRTDLKYLAQKLRVAYADLRNHVGDLPNGQKKPTVPDLEVALFGWSWRNLTFEGYAFAFDKNGVLRMQAVGALGPSRAYPLHLMGDAATQARRRIVGLLKDRGRPLPQRGKSDARIISEAAFLDWEPLEVLTDMVADGSVRTVGGMPQVFRIYQYGEAEPFVWRTADGGDYFGGRPVQAGERFDRRVLTLVEGQVDVSFSDRSIYYGPQAETPENLTP